MRVSLSLIACAVTILLPARAFADDQLMGEFNKFMRDKAEAGGKAKNTSTASQDPTATVTKTTPPVQAQTPAPTSQVQTPAPTTPVAPVPAAMDKTINAPSKSSSTQKDTDTTSGQASASPQQTAVEATSAETKVDWSTRLTGDWGHYRRDLYEHGLDVSLVYKGELNHNLSGGLRRGHAYLTNVDLKIAADMEKMLGWTGGHVFLYGLFDHGQHPSEYNGDALGTSNIETAEDAAKMYEAWIQQDLAGGKASILAGLHDLNSEFYVCDSAGLFFNSNFALGKELSQSGVSGPSIFPMAAPALRFRADPDQSFYLQAAVFDGQAGEPGSRHAVQAHLKSSDGVIMIAEAGLVPSKLAIGAWTYTRTFDYIDGSGNQGVSSGTYILFDKSWNDQVATFAHYGVASPRVNRFDASWALGLVLTGLVPTRDKDRFGIGYTGARNSDHYRKAQEAAGTPVKDAETVIEVNYRAEIYHGVAIQPSYQAIRHPNTDPERSRATVGSVRLEVSL